MDEPRPRLRCSAQITRRDVIQGAVVALAASAAPQIARAEGADLPFYPPLATGLRGSHAGSFEAAHALRDGEAVENAGPVSETYDLIIVGGGISGLAAAVFTHDANPAARILILENHDDFGGHAKRNEFDFNGLTRIINGGTLGIESPTPYSAVADGLLRRIGIDVAAINKTAAKPVPYGTTATFFDRETFGADKLVIGLGKRPWPEALAEAPLTPKVRASIVRLETGTADYLPQLTSDQKKQRLSRISYADYLTKIARADPGVLPYYQTRPQGWWGVGIDAITALDAWAMGYPGFKGLALAPGAIDRMGNTPHGIAATGGSYSLHFPDGNATVARLLVRALVPAALPGKTAMDSITSKVDYTALDRPGQPVRLRLNSIAVNARNMPDGGVEVIYTSRGRLHRVAAKGCVMACWNMIIPYLCPEMPEAQKTALRELVKIPLVYTSVALTNWRAFANAGVSSLSFPGGYFHNASLESSPAFGGYTLPTSPDQPILLRLTRVPCAPGLSEHDQNRAGRAELLATPFETFETQLRDQLTRALGAHGFDADRDISAITVNRWPHGYAPEYNPLWDDGSMPHITGRARFGRITIANSDAGRSAYTDCAIDQAHRAVTELLV